MHKSLKILSLFAFATLSACGGGSQLSPNSSLGLVRSQLHAVSNFTPWLGDPAVMALHSVNSGGTPCIDLSKVGTSFEPPSGGIFFDSSTTTSSLKNILGLNGGVYLTQSELRADAMMQELDAMYNDSTNINLVYYAFKEGQTSSDFGRSVDLADLTQYAKNIITQGKADKLSDEQIAQRLYMACGDGFVSSYKSLVMVLTRINIHFNSSGEQQTFTAALAESGGNVAKMPAADVLIKLSQIAKSQNVTGTISLYANQFGGHPENLFKQFKSVTECSFTSTQACQNLIEGIREYSKTISDQLKDAHDYYTIGNPTINKYQDATFGSPEGLKLLRLYENYPEYRYSEFIQSASLRYAKIFVDNVRSDTSVLTKYLEQYDLDLVKTNSPLIKLNGIKTALTNLKIVLDTGRDTSADLNGYGKFTNMSKDTLNSACFYPSSIYPYESQIINATTLKNIQTQITASKITKDNPLLNSQCGQYLVTILSQINQATQGLVTVNFNQGLNYTNDYLAKIQAPPLVIGGEYARYLKNNLYLVPDYFSNGAATNVYNLVGGDINSDEIRDSKFLVDIDGAENKSSIKLAGIIKDATIRRFPLTINATPFLGQLNPDFYGNSYTVSSIYQPLAAQDLVIAPLYNDSEGCVKYAELAGGNTYRCIGNEALGVAPVQANENNTAAAAFYDLMFRHIELNNYEAYSLSRFNNALAELNINSLSAENIVAQKLACNFPNLVLLSNYSDNGLKLECVTPADYKSKFSAAKCRYDQLAYKDFKNSNLTGCYPQEEVQLFNPRDSIFTALSNLGAYPKFATTDEVLNQQAKCNYPNQAVLYLWGQPVISKAEFKCATPTDQQKLAIPMCASGQVSAYVANDLAGTGALFKCYPGAGDEIKSEQEDLVNNYLLKGYEQLNNELAGLPNIGSAINKNITIESYKNCPSPSQLHLTYLHYLPSPGAKNEKLMGYFECLTSSDLQEKNIPSCSIKSGTIFSVDGSDLEANGRPLKHTVTCY